MDLYMKNNTWYKQPNIIFIILNCLRILQLRQGINFLLLLSRIQLMFIDTAQTLIQDIGISTLHTSVS